MFIPYTYSVCVGTLVMVEYVQWMGTMMAILITLLLLYVLAKIFQANFTNETSSQITIALADLVEATTPPEDRSSLYAQVQQQSYHYQN